MAANTHTYNTVEESDESRGNIDRVKAVWDYLGKPYVPTGDLLQAVSLVTELDEQVTKDLDSPLLAALLVFVIEFNNYYPFSASIPEYINIRQQTRSHAVAINKLLAEYFMLPIVPAKALRVGRYEGFPLFKSSAIPKARSLSLFKEETDFELPRLLAKRAGIRLLCREAEELWFAKKDPALREVIKSALEEQRDILAQDSTNRLVKLFRVYKKLEKAGLSAVTPVLQCLKELLNTWNSVTTGQVDFANASVYYSKAASNALQMAHALDVELVAEWNSWYKHFSEASNGLIQFHHSIENLSTFPCSPIKLADILRKELENNPLVYDQFFSAILLLVDDVFGLAWELCQIEEAQVTLGKLLRHLLFEIRTITSLSGLDRVWWAENLAAFVHTLSTRSDPEEIIEKFSQRSDAPELSILVEQFAQKFGGTEQTQGNTGSAAATSQAQTPPLPPNYNNSLVDPWVEYKNASSAGDWVAAEQWLNQIPSTNPYFTEVDKHRNILKESRFFTDFPQLSWVPGKLHSAKHRRNWGEFERLYSDAENIIHAKNPNLTLPKSILEFYEVALKCKDSEVVIFEAEQSVKKGEFIEAGKKVELATQLDLTNTKAVAVEEKASEGIALSSDLKRFRRKTSASKDEILEMLEKARRLYQDIAPNSSEAEGHYRFMQEEVDLPSELADINRRSTVTIDQLMEARTLLIDLEPKLPKSRTLQKFKEFLEVSAPLPEELAFYRRRTNLSNSINEIRDAEAIKAPLDSILQSNRNFQEFCTFLQGAKDGCINSIKTKAEINLQTLDSTQRPNATLEERRKACEQMEILIKELTLLNPNDADISLYQRTLNNYRSTLDDMLERRNMLRLSIDSLRGSQQNALSFLNSSDVEGVITELRGVYIYAPNDPEIRTQASNLVNLLEVEIKRVVNKQDFQGTNLLTAHSFIKLVESIPPPGAYDSTANNIKGQLEHAIHIAVNHWLSQTGMWMQYEQNVRRAEGIAKEANSIQFLAASPIASHYKLYETIRSTCSTWAKRQVEPNTMSIDSLREAVAAAGYVNSLPPPPGGYQDNLSVEIVNNTVSRISNLITEAKRTNSRNSLKEAEEMLEAALSYYRNDNHLIGLQAEYKTAETVLNRRNFAGKAWKPMLIVFVVLAVLGIFTLTTNSYWEKWKEGIIGTVPPPPTPTPIPTTSWTLISPTYCAPSINNPTVKFEYVGNCHNVKNDGTVTMLDYWNSQKNKLGAPISELLLDGSTGYRSQFFQYGMVEFKPNETNSDRTNFFIRLLGLDLVNCYSGTEIQNSSGVVFDFCLDLKTKQPIYKGFTPVKPVDMDFVKKIRDAAVAMASSPSGKNCLQVTVRNHNVCDEHGFLSYFNGHGEIATLGAPATEEFQALFRDGRQVWIQFFERSILVSDPSSNNGQPIQLEIGKLYLEDFVGSQVINTLPPVGTPSNQTTLTPRPTP